MHALSGLNLGKVKPEKWYQLIFVGDRLALIYFEIIDYKIKGFIHYINKSVAQA